jgi:outer membrane lipoprotein-sorting protein
MTWILALTVLAAGEPPQGFEAFFVEFAKKRDGIHALEARFSQENVSPEETIDSQGSIVYVKPRRIIFRYEKPNPGTAYLLDGNKAYEYEEKVKQLQIYDLENNPQTEVFFLGFNDNTEALRKTYDVGVFTCDDKALGSKGITIRPKKDAQEKEHFREVRIHLRDADFLPSRIHIVNDDESEVFITVSDYKINDKLDPAKTQLTIVEGTKVIQNDEFLETVGPGGKQVPASQPVIEQPLPEPAAKEPKTP